MFPCRFKDLLARNHYSKVNHSVSVTRQHNPDDILADIVNIPFHSRNHKGLLILRSSERSFLGLHKWL